MLSLSVFIGTFTNRYIQHIEAETNGRYFADDIFVDENVWIPIKISLKFVPKGRVNNIPALVQIMAWRRPCNDGKFTDAYMRHSASMS